MTEYNLYNQYFKWLCKLVEDGRYIREYSYKRLFAFLHSIDFSYSIGMDGNREIDGIDLRYRFGAENNYEQAMIATILDVKPCSVFEMMCALSIRCEESIMNAPDRENGFGELFWIMIKNLGLESMDDSSFDKNYVDIIIHRFLNREYAPNGDGGLFIVNKTNVDLRTVEIWNQMCWYLDDYLHM